ncbi:hypothetical protein RCL_jg25046.t1 [Rhizophagus clarus]|uniref:Uncharacterized protein n=1 Tax=Rhizophagus clarus TaxID=94130 RepID=A0A8H3LQ66_9GLOM|nr:hypothetical protein RCL_jg25046.t1 [Rhizophagus clarus]
MILFDVIKQLTGKPIQVKHIHGNGWSYIVGDFDMAQMKGLGLTLHSLDTTREWEIHIMNIFKNLHNKHFSNQVKRKMISLLKATNKVELDEIFSDIEKTDEDGVKNWVDYYRKPYILASINSSASLMDVEIWNRYVENTNMAEAAHSLVNRTGKQLKLFIGYFTRSKIR